MHIAVLPSEPVQLTSDRPARQLSRIGSASIASKLDGQLQVAGVVVPSLVAASFCSAPVLPPHAAIKGRASTDASRTETMLEDYATARPRRQSVARKPNRSGTVNGMTSDVRPSP
jgi:hypothetical protein